MSRGQAQGLGRSSGQAVPPFPACRIPAGASLSFLLRLTPHILQGDEKELQ